MREDSILVCKSIRMDGTQFSLALESLFWGEVDKIAKRRFLSRVACVCSYLRAKPEGVGRASWVRQCVVTSLVSEMSSE